MLHPMINQGITPERPQPQAAEEQGRKNHEVTVAQVECHPFSMKFLGMGLVT